jgi:hypothetical protein
MIRWSRKSLKKIFSKYVKKRMESEDKIVRFKKLIILIE